MDEDREPSQPPGCPDLDGEEVSGGQDVPVRSEKLSPGCSLHAFGRAFQAVLLEHVGDGASRGLMTEVIEGTPDALVAPVAILGGHPDDQPADLVQ